MPNEYIMYGYATVPEFQCDNEYVGLRFAVCTFPYLQLLSCASPINYVFKCAQYVNMKRTKNFHLQNTIAEVAGWFRIIIKPNESKNHIFSP